MDYRIPFDLYGRGLGPKFRFGFETLDVGKVALGGSHTYEIPVQNNSEIPGLIKCDGLIGPGSGLQFKIEPHCLQLAPYQYGAFYVNFYVTGTIGKFEDEIKFHVRETGDVVYVTVKGSLDYPSIRFSMADIQLGILSFGFPRTYSIPLINDSLNHVQVDVKVESDGTDPPVEQSMFFQDIKDEQFKLPGNPAEFQLEPTKFMLKPRGIEKLQVQMKHVKTQFLR